MMMNSVVIVFVAIAAISQSVVVNDHKKSIYFKDCSKGDVVELKSVSVTPCHGKNSKVCPLVRGWNHTISVTFVAKKSVESMKAMVRGKVDKIVAPFPLQQDNACIDSNIVCPLQAEQTYTYAQTVHVQTFYPKKRVLVNWNVYNMDGRDPNQALTGKGMICFWIAAQIIDESAVAALDQQ